MRRSRSQKSTVGVSLFPFLAVLICTMGALIVLLVLVVQLARVHAAEEPAAPLPAVDPLKVEKDDFAWRRTVLGDERELVLEQATLKRLELGHLEEHIRELEKQGQLLRQTAADLQQRMQQEDNGSSAVQEQLESLQEQIRRERDALQDAKSKAAQQPPLYSIVPYDGPNGTHRRPIYLECRADGVVIQPEGIVLTAQDFQGPLGPGNPLDAALRAVREYYARLGAQGQYGEPYPLIVVRPGGVESYALARTAMRHWDDEFGYELVDADMQLKYPAADPTLAQLLQKVARDARSRQQALAAAMPSQFGSRDEVGFVASPTRGGFVPAGGWDERRGQRSGGFGQGGDDRYQDGYAPSAVAGPDPPGEQTAGGELARGHAEGHAGAAVGGGCSPLAQQRGRNWGLPGATDNATGVVRPIRMAVLPDRLIILPDRGQARMPQVVLIEGAMHDEMDEFVGKVWDIIEDWGMAVVGGYWKPVLQVTVAQGAEQRFEEFRTLLEGSGLDVQRSRQ